MRQTKVHNLIILDESGSMSSIKSQVISGFNQTINTIREAQQTFADQEHTISIISFNGFGTKMLHFCDPITPIKEIDSKRYAPAASTPLYDAIGFAVSKLKLVVGEDEKFHALVTILTDGEENASTEYSAPAIRQMIGELSESNWTFTYIGTDHDVSKAAADIAVKHSMSFQKDCDGIETMFSEERKMRKSIYRKIFG
ncbi:hypothetical protein [Sphingobacterium sp. WOUb80]|uniref:hypothetical protein n=1 Tax=Sphingobacterium sp. WOUb80 TaxID=3234028 RepID=UPI003CF8BB9A